jgi:two-component system, chemotaxis family, sensor kinase Cph1
MRERGNGEDERASRRGDELLVNVGGTELYSSDTRERYRQKLARITLDSMVQFVGLLDTKGTVLEINQVALDAVRMKLSDVEGKPFWATFWWQVSEEVRAELKESVRRAARGEFVRWDTEIYWRAGGKGTTIIDASLSPVKDTQGNVVFIAAEGRDITERKAHELARIESNLNMARFRQEMAAAEQAFVRLTAESEQRRRLYETILASTPDFVYTFDLNHRFTYANEALLTMWGKTAAEAIGKNCLELGYEPWHAAMHDGEIDQVIATKQPIRGDVPFSGTRGRRIYDYLFVPVFNASGEVEAVAGTTRDVTERKLAEEKIRASEERLRFMAESMPQKIFTATWNGEIDYFNRQWMQFTGLTFEEIAGWKWVEIIHPDDAEETRRLWRCSIDSGESFQFTHRFRRFDGTYRWHLSRIQPMRSEDGKVMMWIGSSTEIQEQKDTEEELRRANQDLEQFAYAASHDLQEPLRGINIYSQLLERRYRNALDEQGLKFLRHLTDGASRMEILVHDLLAYTRVIQAERPTEPVDATAALSVALDNLAGAISESGALVTYDPLPILNIHFTQLQQLFQNLVGNAIKYRRFRQRAKRRAGYLR